MQVSALLDDESFLFSFAAHSKAAPNKSIERILLTIQ